MNERELIISGFLDGIGDNLFIIVTIFLIALILVLLYVIYVEKRSSAWLSQREHTAKMVFSFKSVPFLYSIQTKIANKLAIANTASKQENEKYAIYVMVFIAVSAIAIIAGLWQFVNNFAYAFFLLLAIGIVIPWMLFNIFYEFQLASMIKQLPTAIDEFASSYRKSNKVFNALKDSYQYMPKVVSKEFERLYKAYNINFEEGVEYFRSRIKNDWAGIFASLLLINYTKGGSIIAQLDDLNTEIENDIIAKDKVRSKMLGFKLLSLSTLGLTVAAIFANMMMSDSAKEYYMNPAGQAEILVTLLVGFITFLCMMIVEKL